MFIFHFKMCCANNLKNRVHRILKRWQSSRTTEKQRKMDYHKFFEGIGWLVGAYLYYRFMLKDEKPSSKETNWRGMTQTNYIGAWWCVIFGSVIKCMMEKLKR